MAERGYSFSLTTFRYPGRPQVPCVAGCRVAPELVPASRIWLVFLKDRVAMELDSMLCRVMFSARPGPGVGPAALGAEGLEAPSQALAVPL